MMMSEKLTAKEKKWVASLEGLLLNPPSDRIGLYTIGDCDLIIYDKRLERDLVGEEDFCTMVESQNAALGSIRSEANIHSVSG